MAYNDDDFSTPEGNAAPAVRKNTAQQQAQAAADNAVTKQLSSVSAGVVPALPKSANEAGKLTRTLVGNAAGAVSNAVSAGTGAVADQMNRDMRPVKDAGIGIADYARGLAGYGPISSASGQGADTSDTKPKTVVSPTTTAKPDFSDVNSGASNTGGTNFSGNTNSGGSNLYNPATASQRSFLTGAGVPASAMSQNPVGGDFTGDSAQSDVRNAITNGSAPGEYRRLGLDKSSQIYATSSRPGGPLDTFVGVGSPDDSNPSTSIGQDAVTLQNAGLGTPRGSTSSSPTGASGSADSGSGARGSSSPAVDPTTMAYERALSDQQSAVDRAQGRMADVGSGDWRSASGTASHNAQVELASQLRSAGRWGGPRAIAGDQQAAMDQYNKSMGGLMGGGYEPAKEATALADAFQRNVGEYQRGLNQNATTLQAARLNNDARVNSAEARADAMRYGADRRLSGSQYTADQKLAGVQDTNARPRQSEANNKAYDAAVREYEQSSDNPGKTPEDKQTWAQRMAAGRIYRATSSAEQPPVAGAQKAPDGKWYVKQANGKYAMVNQ